MLACAPIHPVAGYGQPSRIGTSTQRGTCHRGPERQLHRTLYFCGGFAPEIDDKIARPGGQPGECTLGAVTSKYRWCTGRLPPPIQRTGAVFPQRSVILVGTAPGTGVG
jgi:hypothetical protein